MTVFPATGVWAVKAALERRAVAPATAVAVQAASRMIAVRRLISAGRS